MNMLERSEKEIEFYPEYFKDGVETEKFLKFCLQSVLQACENLFRGDHSNISLLKNLIRHTAISNKINQFSD